MTSKTAKRLADLIRQYEIPAMDPTYCQGGMFPDFIPGWYYQPEGRLGEWVFLGSNAKEAAENYVELREFQFVV